MNYFNRSNNEELSGISYCSCDSIPTSSIISDKISSISLGNETINFKIDKYDKIIDVLFKDIKQLQDVVFSQQEKRSNKLSEWREFDLEAATGRESLRHDELGYYFDLYSDSYC